MEQVKETNQTHTLLDMALKFRNGLPGDISLLLEIIYLTRVACIAGTYSRHSHIELAQWDTRNRSQVKFATKSTMVLSCAVN